MAAPKVLRCTSLRVLLAKGTVSGAGVPTLGGDLSRIDRLPATGDSGARLWACIAAGPSERSSNMLWTNVSRYHVGVSCQLYCRAASLTQGARHPGRSVAGGSAASAASPVSFSHHGHAFGARMTVSFQLKLRLHVFRGSGCRRYACGMPFLNGGPFARRAIQQLPGSGGMGEAPLAQHHRLPPGSAQHIGHSRILRRLWPTTRGQVDSGSSRRQTRCAPTVPTTKRAAFLGVHARHLTALAETESSPCSPASFAMVAP